MACLPLLSPPSLVDEAVDVVLDGVVAASRKMLGDAGPCRAVLCVQIHDVAGLVFRDGIVPQIRVEVLVVSLAALLCVARSHVRGDADPVLGAHQPHECHQAVALLGRPRALSGLENAAPHDEGSELHRSHGHQLLRGDEVNLPRDVGRRDGSHGVMLDSLVMNR